MQRKKIIFVGFLAIISTAAAADADKITKVLANENQKNIPKHCLDTLEAGESYESDFQHGMLSSASGESSIKPACSFDTLKKTANSDKNVFDQKEKTQVINKAKFSVVDDSHITNERTRFQQSVTQGQIEEAEFSKFTLEDGGPVEKKKTVLQSTVTK